MTMERATSSRWLPDELVGGPYDGGVMQMPPMDTPGVFRVVRRVNGKEMVTPAHAVMISSGRQAELKGVVFGEYRLMQGQDGGHHFEIWVWEDIEWPLLLEL